MTYWDWTLVPILDDQGEVELLVFSLRNVTARKRAELELQSLNESLHQQAAQLRRLTAELTLAEQRERRRLAQVLHDHLQQLLVAARLKVSIVRRRLDPGNEEPSVPQLDELLQRAIEESRSLTVELSPPVLYEAGLVAALEWLAGQMEVKHALHVDVIAHLDCVPIAEDVRVILFQAVRELLFNVVKHAQTTLARIELRGERDGLVEIVVADGGAGFDAANRQTPETTSGGFGLFSIRERLELMGGGWRSLRPRARARGCSWRSRAFSRRRSCPPPARPPLPPPNVSVPKTPRPATPRRSGSCWPTITRSFAKAWPACCGNRPTLRSSARRPTARRRSTWPVNAIRT